MLNALKIFLVIGILSPASALAVAGEQCKPGQVEPALCNPITLGSSIPEVIGKLFMTVGSLLALMAIMMIVFSGFRMLISQGDPEQLKKAKEGIKYSVVGFGISLLSYVIVATIEKFIGASINGDPSNDKIYNPLGKASLVQFLQGSILPNFFGVLGLIALVMVIISGFRYMFAGVNEEQAKKGKESLQWSLIGLVVILLSYVIIKAVESLLRS